MNIKNAVRTMENKCKLCKKIIYEQAITHVAGFPEREHLFCSEQCLAYFLRLEDDELDYEVSPNKEKGEQPKK